jgi:pilus assembly protein FimV
MSRAARLFVVGGVMAAMPVISHALGLGNLTVDSALNESLKAEIEFTSANRKELKSLNVTLAPRGAFDTAGIQWLPYLSDIKFTVARRLDGRSFIQLTSEQPIREPFLHFLLQAEWVGGRLTREFTALIDPPYLLAGRAPPVNVPQTSSSEAIISAPPPVTGAVPEAVPQAAAEPLPATPAPVAQPGMAVAEPERAPEPQPTVSAPAEPGPVVAAAPEPEPTPVATTDFELLGPPEMGDSSVAISPDTGWPVVASAAPTTAMPTQTDVVITEAAVAAAAGTRGPAWATTGRYEVKRGDTLWHIAESIRLDQSLSIEQVVLALYEANRDAFFDNNVNNVWAGKVLMIPERPEVQVLSAQDARLVFLAQYDDWQAYKIKLASASQTIKVASEPAVTEQAEASVTREQESAPARGEQPSTTTQQEQTKPGSQSLAAKTQQDEQPIKAQETPQKPRTQKSTDAAGTAAVAARARRSGDLLKIVRATIERESAGKTAKAAEGESAMDSEQAERLALAERATTLDESLDSRQMQQQELEERIDTVGSQIQKEKRLIEIENESLAQAQPDAARSEKAGGASKSSAAEVAAAGGAAATQKGAAKATPAKPKAQAKPAPRSASAEKKTAQAKTATQPKKRKPRRITPPPKPEEKGMLATVQDIMSDYMMQAVAAIVALAGGLILLTYLKRRRQAEAEFEESILTDTGATTEEPAITDSGERVTTSAGNTSFLSDFSQGGMGNISTDEVDPLAETEVYLAYGRDEQAEEILKEAVAKDPSRHELKVKLLEIYSQRNDVSAFETLAEELYAALEGRGGDLWNKVADIGRRLNPDNPMFQGLAPMTGPSVPEPIPVAPEMSAAPPAEEPESPPGLEFEPAPGAVAGLGLDDSALELDAGTAAGEVAAAPTDSDLEFDLDMETAAAAAKEEGSHLGDTSELAAQDMGVAAAAEAAAEEELGLGDQPADNVVDFDITAGDALAEAAVAVEDTSAGAEVLDAVPEAAVETALDEPTSDTEPGSEDLQQWDETATKLDLAKAYVDMGDAEGARSILDEVLAEGNEDQKKQAAELAAQIA